MTVIVTSIDSMTFKSQLSVLVVLSGSAFAQVAQDQVAKTSAPLFVSPNDAQENLLRRPVCKSPEMVPDGQNKGTVRIAVVINQKGGVTAAKVTSGPPMLY